MADVYWKRKEYERAEKLYREAYDLDPENRRHDLFSVVLCQNNTKRYAEMVPLLQTLLPYAQEDKQSYAYCLGIAYKNLEQYEEALKYFYLEQETFTDEPEYEMSLFNCVFCEEKLEHYDKAATAIKKLIEQSDDDEIRALGLYRLGVLCLRQQQFATALEHFDQAVALDPEMEEYQQAREEALKHLKSKNPETTT
jgi:tetratricopeptide (TPR) repeat protein